ncbi:MAG: helix-turn-helix transcriptional regulator [Gammaproteobacteria bacterium]
MEKISIQTLNTLFEQLNDRSDTVLWIRSADYTRQIYVSPGFENLWQTTSEQIYKNPNFFDESVMSEDKNYIVEQTENRVNNPNQADKSILYRIHTPSNTVHIKDTCFQLISPTDNIVGHAGIAERIDPERWHAEKSLRALRNNSVSENSMQKFVFETIKKELGLNATTQTKPILKNDVFSAELHKFQFNGKNLPLTERESECLFYTMLGKSAKVVASLMNVSTRTVEFH